MLGFFFCLMSSPGIAKTRGGNTHLRLKSISEAQLDEQRELWNLLENDPVECHVPIHVLLQPAEQMAQIHCVVQ